MQRNFLCDMVALKKKDIKPIQNISLKRTVENVWKNRNDFTEQNFVHSQLKETEAA